MLKIAKIFLVSILGVIILVSAYWFVSFSRIFVKEQFTASFDNQYEYTQLSSPKKTLCTIVILENKESGKDISYTLPYFNDRTIRKIAWGLSSNDLFVDSADTGLTIYRMLDGIWTPCYLIIEDNPDGTEYSLHIGGNPEQRALQYELLSDTIPQDIKIRISETRQKFGDKVFEAPNE